MQLGGGYQASLLLNSHKPRTDNDGEGGGREEEVASGREKGVALTKDDGQQDDGGLLV